MTEKQRQENLVVAKKRMQTLKNSGNWWYESRVEQLNHCQATVYETQRYILLRSYQTIVAGIDKETETCYDWLRLVYGYTATSAQHIRKFMRKFGVVNKKTWRD